MNICDAVELISGTPQFRIVEDADSNAPVYRFYSQTDLESDLSGLPSAEEVPRKQVRTSDAVNTTSVGDVVFSLLSGTAAIVQAEHAGYLLTQNYVTIVPSECIDARYLVYLLNETKYIKRQLHRGQQGSVTMKYTLKQLGGLELPQLPHVERQGLIGGVYFDQLKLAALRVRASELETNLVLAAIREADRS
ncbi:hypothetical protein [uncultured Enorma sp.]|uniref:hypothetical protein n=1 Tax=uncultured Enorma sp. TaxID=1714346 RepID=UPI0026225B87|nr:hypothetical protein [uncultured Enorma sp.]